MGTEHEPSDPEDRGSALAKLRGILVSSLSRENLSPVDVERDSSPESPGAPRPPARRRRKVRFSESKSVDFLDRAGATPESQRNSRPSSAKQGSGAWDIEDSFPELNAGSLPLTPNQGKESTASQLDREERLRIVREKQNEERQKKLEELKQQALAAQKFREQKEEERRRRMEELRLRDTDRRYQVEERKRQIWQAEKDRREAILRKNQEREARIETKRKNERSSIIFAFGSSTPRMLEPADTGGSYWATRRATSTSNVMMMSMSAAPGPLTRRSSERELEGSKKRATSAGGINRSKQPDGVRTSIYDVFQWNSPGQLSAPLSPVDPFLSPGGEECVDGEESGTVTPVPSARAARRKTDLVPTLPSPRDLTPRPMRSPGRAYSMSRLDILAQPRKPRTAPVVETTSERDPALSRSMTHLAGRPQRLRRTDTSRSMVQLSGPPVPPPRATRAERLRRKAREAANIRAESVPTSPGLRSGEVTPSRPQSSLSQHSVCSGAMSSSVHAAFKPRATPRRPRPYSIAVTGVSSDASPTTANATRHSLSSEHRNAKSPAPTLDKEKPPLPKVHAAKKPTTPKPEAPKKQTDKIKSTKSSASPTPKATPLQSPGAELASSSVSETLSITTSVTSVTTVSSELGESVTTTESVDVTVVENSTPTQSLVPQETSAPQDTPSPQEVPTPQEVVVVPDTPVHVPTTQPSKETIVQEPATDLADCDMTASMLAKARITTEEEAKAALAERRRLAREQAEREAELERQRLEAERLAEEQRLREEEEEQKRMEEEQLRLLEEARHAEQERLRQAIEEAQKKEEEEKRQREEEARQKIEKEEMERKAREEAEKQRLEMEIRLKKEEEDRLERRKRVEAIMSRTRGKGSTPSNTPTKEDGVDSPNEEPRQMSDQEQFLHSERSHSAANTAVKQNGHQNGVDNVVEQNNVTNTLLDLSIENVGVSPLPEQILAPTTNSPTNGKLVNEDSVNFNTAPPTNPFIDFQDNKKQDTVNDLLS